jgi:regulator of sigma E protease
MAFVESIWWMIVLIGIMIVIHELGHYWAARYFDVKIDAFAIGFGPKLWGVRRGETEWKICAIPFGGYVKMAGSEHEEKIDDPRGFMNKPRWQRMVIAIAGPLMNILLALVLLAGLFSMQFPKPLYVDQPAKVGSVQPDSPVAKAGVQAGDTIVRIEDQANPTWSDVGYALIHNINRPVSLVLSRDGGTVPLKVTPKSSDNGLESLGWHPDTDVVAGRVEPDLDAARQGLKTGDQIVSINGAPVRAPDALVGMVRKSKGEPLTLVYRRDGKDTTVTVTPVSKKIAEVQNPVYMIGIAATPATRNVQLSPIEAIQESASVNYKSAGLIYGVIRSIFEARLSPKTIEGPVRMAQMSRQAAKEGFDSYITLMAGVSLNLAIFNLLPIPILDGGVILMLLIEMIARRDLSLRLKEMVFTVSFVFLISLVAFVLYNDIQKVLKS